MTAGGVAPAAAAAAAAVAAVAVGAATDSAGHNLSSDCLTVILDGEHLTVRLNSKS